MQATFENMFFCFLNKFAIAIAPNMEKHLRPTLLKTRELFFTIKIIYRKKVELYFIYL